MQKQMLYLAASMSIAACAEISTAPTKIHGVMVHTLTLSQRSVSDDDDGLEAFKSEIEALKDKGWADTPTEAWEDVEEDAADAGDDGEAEGALARIKYLEGVYLTEDEGGPETLEAALRQADEDFIATESGLSNAVDELKASKSTVAKLQADGLKLTNEIKSLKADAAKAAKAAKPKPTVTPPTADEVKADTTGDDNGGGDGTKTA